MLITTRNVEKAANGAARLQAYTDSGHVLGNHSHTHQWLSRIDTDDYIADLDQARENLSQYDNVLPFYRYPYLDEGRAIDKRDALRKTLAERGLRNGYVTIDTYDWHLDALAKEARGAGVDFEVAALYIGDLVAKLRERGFRIISPSEAFSDPIAEREPDTLFLGQGRIAALAHEAGWAARDLVSPTEDEDYLRRRFEEEVVTLPTPRGSE